MAGFSTLRQTETVLEISLSKNTERRAVEFVMRYEKNQGRSPKDVGKKKVGYDIKSDGRLIEVKGQSSKRPDYIFLYKQTLNKLGDQILNYYIYLVYDMKNEPKLKILPPEKIFGNRRENSQGSFIIRKPGHRKNFIGARSRRRGQCPFFSYFRFGIRGNVCRSWSKPSPRFI